MVYDDGRLINPNVADYMIPSFQDLPERFTLNVLEHPGEGEIHGIGETSVPPVMPAIANAVCRAVGARLTALPLTPEKIIEVLLDGKPISSCLTLAALAAGKRIVTVEALAEGDRLHPIQQAFVDYTAFQCSYCTPGFILTTKAFLEESPTPTEEQVRHYLAGNLCRCGSYVKITEAVLDAAGRMESEE